MKQQISKNERLDRLGAEVLKTSTLRDDEIESIADGRELFSAVRARIIADRVAEGNVVGPFTFFHRTMIVSSAVAVIAIAVFGTFIATRRVDQKTLASRVPVVEKKSPPKADVSNYPNYVYVDPEPEQSRPHIEKAMDYRPVPERRTVTQKQQPQYQEPPQQFYALADMHPTDENIANTRVIRVDLPRASLVALGVNIPLDSDKQMIKTDLLVGPDGVPRAIRLVD